MEAINYNLEGTTVTEALGISPERYQELKKKMAEAGPKYLMEDNKIKSLKIAFDATEPQTIAEYVVVTLWFNEIKNSDIGNIFQMLSSVRKETVI